MHQLENAEKLHHPWAGGNQSALKVISFQSCPSKDTAPLASVLTALVGGTELSESKDCSEITLCSLLSPAVPCLAHWCDMSCLDLVTECVRSSQSSLWSFQVPFPCTYPARNLLHMPLLHSQILGKPVSTEVQCSGIWLEKLTPGQ